MESFKKDYVKCFGGGVRLERELSLKYMAQVFGLLVLVMLGAGFMDNGQSIPTPGGTYALERNLFINKDYVSNATWQTYMLWRQGDAALLPDTGITYNGAAYFTNPAYAKYPVVGLSVEQMQGMCDWITAFTDTLKRSATNTCAKRYWKRIRAFDPADTLMMQLFIPEHGIDARLKSAYGQLGLSTYYSDAVISVNESSGFNKPVMGFRYAVIWVRRN